MTATTSVLQRSNPPTPPTRHPRPPFLGVCKRHSPAENLGPGEQHKAPWKEPVEATGATLAKAGELSRGSLGSRSPLWPGERPRHPLNPAGLPHPAISGPLPPSGLEAWRRGVSIWPM